MLKTTMRPLAIVMEVCTLYPLRAQTVKPFTNSVGIKMIGVQNGTFNMGAETTRFQLGKVTVYSKDAPYYDETPVHAVTITSPFYISETEVTIEQSAGSKKNTRER